MTKYCLAVVTRVAQWNVSLLGVKQGGSASAHSLDE
ncbi:hypothetical protein HDG34_003138 [Paraburkholderia sp. HC6.4b]|nr:hypothetical protein [Paraburkholderia sp. HC6.4b]MBB5450925.1 hypothetical protein [Paraburkholderia sp. Kb1A]